MKLRSYQTQAIADVADALMRASSVVLQMPTGSGKTVTAVEIARDAMDAGPVWFVCHRREIVRQISKALTEAGIEFGVIAPGHPARPDLPVQVASIDALRGRHAGYPAPSTIIWDECHHVPAKSWSTLMKRFSGACHIGLTATPERLDGKGLEKWFDALVCGPAIKALIEQGHLARYRIFAPTEPDLTEAKIRAGDYSQEDLEKAMNTPVLIGDAVAHYNRIAPGSRALVFAVSVDASRAVVAKFVEQGTPAMHVDGNTPDDERDAAVADLAAGRIRVLSNVNVFTEGTDVPAVDTVILLRPTKSLALYLQMIGRGLRPCDDKEHLTILDHAGLVHEHGFPDADWEWKLDGGARQARLRGARERKERLRRCPQCSRVHGQEPTCPECGYEYPTGREVGEFDGVLYELRGDVPEGCESKATFAKRAGVSKTSVERWIMRGMPTRNGLVVVDEAVSWLENFRARHAGHETGVKFAARYGVVADTVSEWKKRGLPVNANGLVNIAAGTEWVLKNVRYATDDQSETITEFANRIGVKRSTVQEAIKRGLPIDEKGNVVIEMAIAWLMENPPKTIRPLFNDDAASYVSRATFAAAVGRKVFDTRWVGLGLPVASNGWVHLTKGIEWAKKNARVFNKAPIAIDGINWSEYESKRAFARRIGISGLKSSALLISWEREGLPCAPNGYVHISRGIEWAKRRNSNRIPPIGEGRPTEYESGSAFARRIGVSVGTVHWWISKGKIRMPTARNGWVHIRDGLLWVQANTKIQIPDSAWEGVERDADSLLCAAD